MMRNAPPIATASSMNAAGRSLPNSFARRARNACPPSVPITAPAMPASNPATSAPLAAPIAAPDRPPGDDLRGERARHLAAWRRRKLIDHQLAERHRGQDPRCERVAQESARRRSQVEPPQPRRPAHGRRRCHGAQAGDDADQDGEREHEYMDMEANTAPVRRSGHG